MAGFDQNQTIPLLVVEDNAADYESLLRAFRKLKMTNPILHCETGEETLDFLYRRKGYDDPQKAPRPGIIFLDLNLPGTDGRDVLKEIKNDPGLKSIPVIILTTSDSDKDIRECYQSGANSYMTKPVDWDRFFRAIESFKAWWMETSALPN